jgi:hypothetical protein
MNQGAEEPGLRHRLFVDVSVCVVHYVLLWREKKVGGAHKRNKRKTLYTLRDANFAKHVNANVVDQNNQLNLHLH